MKPSFKINKKEYFFEELTLRKYYELKKILASEHKEAEFQIVECITKCPVEELKKLKFQDWLLVWVAAESQIKELQGDTTAIRPVVEFNGIKYGLPQIEEMTIGEFADLDIIFASGSPEAKLAEIAAVLYRPVVSQQGETLTLEPYDTEGFKVRAEAFQDFPLTAIRSANSFFLQSVNSSLKNIADSLISSKEMKSLSLHDQDNLKNLLQQGPGGEPSIFWLEKILSDFQKQPSSRYAQLSTGSPGKKPRLLSRIWPFNRKQNIL